MFLPSLIGKCGSGTRRFQVVFALEAFRKDDLTPLCCSYAGGAARVSRLAEVWVVGGCEEWNSGWTWVDYLAPELFVSVAGFV